jgi:hypothetical protein
MSGDKGRREISHLVDREKRGKGRGEIKRRSQREREKRGRQTRTAIKQVGRRTCISEGTEKNVAVSLI